ncbi:MAG: response regulator transcription factor [Sphingobacteriales bacterium]|jgi:DNA-binding LytR/AlgR family response regulator|nr:response regulator transcription factor [Sphingobacteriales bacterium]NCT75450.1 response regulator transcription factor [Chitinophagaceae bacterium]OJW31556.1 MAG: DNA-binding response regulator [Sphingobacteriales bacterium 46-32]
MKAVIIEDEYFNAQVLQNKIKSIDPSVEIEAVIPSLKVARKWFLNNAEPDLLFMDIQLSDGVSFELFEQFQLSCPIIFTTAYDEYAIRAFKVNGVDYLLKPVDATELQHAIDKCRNIIQQKKQGNPDFSALMKALNISGSPASQYKERFMANVRNQWMPIAVADIACFARETLNYLYLFSGERYLLDFATLEEVESLLDPQKFYRANRKYIIHIDAVLTVKAVENSKLIVKLKEPNQKLEIDISREKAPAFKKWLDR